MRSAAVFSQLLASSRPWSLAASDRNSPMKSWIGSTSSLKTTVTPRGLTEVTRRVPGVIIGPSVSTSGANRAEGPSPLRACRRGPKGEASSASIVTTPRRSKASSTLRCLGVSSSTAFHRATRKSAVG